jgi:DNA-binding transcriptional LysR family regulator
MLLKYRFTCMQLDFNLLPALDALLEENSVGAAADRLNLSAPAMSRTLSRIRRATGDQILVRTGRTMTPTPYAVRVREQVHALVGQAQALLAPDHGLDLDSLARTFTLQGHDAISTAIGPALLAAVHEQAPMVALRLLPEATVDTLDLRYGRVDLELGSAAPELPEISSQTLAQDVLVLAMRAGHPLGAGPPGPGPLTLRRYAAARHIAVSRRGRLHGYVDEMLAGAGLRRQVAATAPTTTAALYYLRESDLVAMIPDRMCRPLIAALGLCTVPLPFELPPVPVIAAWHQRYDDDRAHRWLRGLVGTSVGRLEDRDQAPA